jgi:hypothetical protein
VRRALECELLDAKHRVAERPELRVDEGLMTPLGATPLDLALTVRYAAITTRSAIQEHLDIFLGRELPLQVFAQACLVARDDEIVPSDDRHTTIFHDPPRRSRSAEPSERSFFPPGFLGKPAGVPPLLPGVFRKVKIPVLGPNLSRIGRVVRGARATPLLAQATLGPNRPRGPRYNIQKLLSGESRRPGSAGGVLDPAVGADDDRPALPLARQANELVVGRVGRAGEDRPDPPMRRAAAGHPRPVEDHRELVARVAVSARQQVKERPPSGLEAFGLAGTKIRLAPDDVVAVDEPAHGLSIPRPTGRKGDSWTNRR